MFYLQDDPPLPALGVLFPYLESDLRDIPDQVDPFTVTTENGFLPTQSPPTELPSTFEPLTNVLAQMPICTKAGTPGLLADFRLGPSIDNGTLPDLTHEVEAIVNNEVSRNLAIVTALFRDYSFLASAYLLEPCWEVWGKDQHAKYGLGRQLLPRCIAGPLTRTAKALDIPPFLSYAGSYALFNYYLEDSSIGASTYSNLRLIRAFENGLDPKSSEAGFILTHIHMVQETGALISGAVSLLKTIEGSPKDLPAAKSAFRTMLDAMHRIEAAMEGMWSHSRPKDYSSYRTFIFGITNQSMFPEGVVYDGENDNKPMFFRGESGANDSIIPLLDHVLEVPMPKNPLTDILIDFRNYRPQPHRQFLAYMMSKAAELRVRQYCTEDSELAQLYLKLLDHVRSFRWRHWLFAREYIIKRSSHPTATGGSPIVTWLPNQLMAVMELMEDVYAQSGLEQTVNDQAEELKSVRTLMENVTDQKVKLEKEVMKYCEERGS